MTEILKINNDYQFIDSFTLVNELPLGVYELNWNTTTKACYLSQIVDKFTLPSTLYEVDSAFRESIIKSFNYYNKNLGVLLQGEKGTGKSICAKILANDIKLPVIMIKNKVPSDIDFTSFLEKYSKEYCLFIDEFEKKFLEFEEDPFHIQDSLLSFFDGNNLGGKRLTILTSNRPISDHFLNRPSRIKFKKNYEGISLELGNLIISSLLENKEFKADLIENLELKSCSIDILISIIEEINCQKMSYSSFKDNFNFTPEKPSYILKEKKGKVWVPTDFFEDYRVTHLNFKNPSASVSFKHDYLGNSYYVIEDKQQMIYKKNSTSYVGPDFIQFVKDFTPFTA